MVELDADLKEVLRRHRASRPEQSPLEATLDAVVLTSDLVGSQARRLGLRCLGACH
jgi:hypothetical protein